MLSLGDQTSSAYLERGHVGRGHHAFDLAHEASKSLSHDDPNDCRCTAAAGINLCRLSRVPSRTERCCRGCPLNAAVHDSATERVRSDTHPFYTSCIQVFYSLRLYLSYDENVGSLQQPPRPHPTPTFVPHAKTKTAEYLPQNHQQDYSAELRSGGIELNISISSASNFNFSLAPVEFQLCDKHSFLSLLVYLLSALHSFIMRSVRILGPQGFSTPRMAHCRPRISPACGVWVTRAVRANATSSSNGTNNQGNSSSSNSSNGSSWSPSRTFLVSALAAGLGYGYASYNQTPTTSKKPQYGSTKDFEKVCGRGSI